VSQLHHKKRTVLKRKYPIVNVIAKEIRLIVRGVIRIGFDEGNICKEDYPVYEHHCFKAGKEDRCELDDCSGARLYLVGYKKWDEGSGEHRFKELPIKPTRVVDFLCVGHTEKNCEECSVWVEQTLGWRVYEWNYSRRDFVSEFRNNGWPPIPTLHGRVDKCEDKESKDIAPGNGLELVRSSQAGPADNTRKQKQEQEEDSEEDTIYLGTINKKRRA
jgi:hypothetical protein